MPFYCTLTESCFKGIKPEFFANNSNMTILFDFFSLFVCSDKLTSEFETFTVDYVFVNESYTLAPHFWWIIKGYKKFPHLSRLAARICQATASASVTERYWSALDFCFSKGRLNMSDTHIDIVIGDYSNLPLLNQEARDLNFTQFKMSMEEDINHCYIQANIWSEVRTSTERSLSAEDELVDKGDESLDVDLREVIEEVHVQSLISDITKENPVHLVVASDEDDANVVQILNYPPKKTSRNT
ncbi:hypothetical protein GEMRC1_010947 [Eukaryota sp. GEM-RC1]